MFLKLLKSVLSPSKGQTKAPATNIHWLYEQAEAAMNSGDKHAAIIGFQQVLQAEPMHVMALNNLGCCLADVGNAAEAAKMFTQAFSIDDSCVPAITNHARLLCEKRMTKDAWPFLQHVKLAAPLFPYVDAVASAAWFSEGNTRRAIEAMLIAWLRDPSNIRAVNNYLWYCGHDQGVGERQLAAEHAFFGEVFRPTHLDQVAQWRPSLPGPTPARRVRVAYWSPDLRDHSVRYFFRPVLRHHDRNRFEVFVLQDAPTRDEQTRLIEAESEHFIDVHQLSDTELVDKIRDLDLDFLVEMAGHTSNNRIHLFQHRLARFQLSGIGYPPTTGMAQMDGKWVDPHILTHGWESYYTERAFCLPQSFWCFDPIDQIAAPDLPPATTQPFITFGAVGNAAKITDQMLSCWSQILASLPDSRLRIRSINFQNEASTDYLWLRLDAAGIDRAQVDIVGPASTAAFFSSYNEYDILLDTHPFNGGTTTAFALYMGVPVITLEGESLIGRMGVTMLRNVGLEECIADSPQAYVKAALALAQDRSRIAELRKTLRQRMQACPLGNGATFTTQLEAEYQHWLAAPLVPYAHAVEPIAPQEVMRRAYLALQNNQVELVQRITDYCLRHHPQFVPAHLLYVTRFAAEDRLQRATAYLTQLLANTPPEDHIPLQISIIRNHLLMQDRQAAARVLDTIEPGAATDLIDKHQIALFRAAIDETSMPMAATARRQTPNKLRIVLFWVHVTAEPTPADSRPEWAQKLIIPEGWQLDFQPCTTDNRHQLYRRTLAEKQHDVAIILHDQFAVDNAEFLPSVVADLDKAEVVSFNGCKVWQQMEWRQEPFAQRAMGVLLPCDEQTGLVEIHIAGTEYSATVDQLAVLDGGMIAFRTSTAEGSEWNDNLISTYPISEEDWTHRQHLRGKRLLVDRTLGIRLAHQRVADHTNIANARWHLAEAYQFDGFFESKRDAYSVSTPCANSVEMHQIAHRYLGKT